MVCGGLRSAGGDHGRRHVPEEAVRPVVVVITPPADGVANVAQSGEPMLGQTRASAAAIESLDAGALHRLVSLDEAQIDAVAGHLCLHRATGELGTVVNAQ